MSNNHRHRTHPSEAAAVAAAIEAADPYRGVGTSYLHVPSPSSSSSTPSSCTTTTTTTAKTNGNKSAVSVASTTTSSTSTSNPTGAVVPPISLSTTFVQSSPGVPTAASDPNSFNLGYEYSRTGNPTRGLFERAVANAEGASYCVAFSSGSAATSAVVHLLKSGEGILCVDDVYGGTQRYLRRIVGETMGISVEFADFNDEGAMRERLGRGGKGVKGKETNGGGGEGKKQDEEGNGPPNKRAKTTDNDGDDDNGGDNGGNGNDEANGTATGSGKGATKLLWLETPTNPTLRISSIRASAALAHDRSALLCVDNTFCSPYNQRPLSHGADLVVHSVTKYIGGHSDVVMGVVCTDDEGLYKRLRFVQNGVGAVPSPFDCYLAHRGLKTLHVRMEASGRNAMALALYLETHPGVAKVVYPGLKSHPQHELAKEQQFGFGAMITFYVRGGRDQSRTFLTHLRVFALAESLGAVESLAECPSLMTHASVPDERRAELGIDDTLIRLSVGIESCKDLVEDVGRALDAAVKSLEDDEEEEK